MNFKRCKLMTAKFDTVCHLTNFPIRKGESFYYDFKTKFAYCVEGYNQAYAQDALDSQDEAFYLNQY